MNPFAGLVAQVTNRSQPQEIKRERVRPPGDMPMARLAVEILKDGPASTAELAALMGCSNKRVWDHLKHIRRAGEVEYASSKWTLCADYPIRPILAAAKLLREHGWTVYAPEEKP